MCKLPWTFTFTLLARPSLNALSAEASGPPQLVTIPQTRIVDRVQ
jgi:hypothetical protein